MNGTNQGTSAMVQLTILLQQHLVLMQTYGNVNVVNENNIPCICYCFKSVTGFFKNGKISTYKQQCK